jgi:hypothetical protein
MLGWARLRPAWRLRRILRFFVVRTMSPRMGDTRMVDCRIGKPPRLGILLVAGPEVPVPGGASRWETPPVPRISVSGLPAVGGTMRRPAKLRGGRVERGTTVG